MTNQDDLTGSVLKHADQQIKELQSQLSQAEADKQELLDMVLKCKSMYLNHVEYPSARLVDEINQILNKHKP